MRNQYRLFLFDRYLAPTFASTMAPLARSLVVAAAALSLVTAAPTSGEQLTFAGEGELLVLFCSALSKEADLLLPLSNTEGVSFKGGDGRPFNPMDHMSGISPYHDAPGASLTPPKGCKVSAMALLMRHSCIHGQ